MPFIEFQKIMAVFPFIGGVIEVNIVLGLNQDGNISTGSGSNISYILSASLTSFTWQGVFFAMLMMAIAAFLLTLYVGLKGR